MPPKLSLAVAQEEARKRGGECLSAVYVNGDTKMLWRCENNHEWWAVLRSIRGSDSWCHRCRPQTLKLSLNDAKRTAAARGGECLSLSYVGCAEKMRWRCAEGHEWDATIQSVRTQKSWCPRCAGNQVGSLDLANQVARGRGGVCLSVRYSSIRTSMRWQCEKGHRFWARLVRVKGGAWCPDCAAAAVAPSTEDATSAAVAPSTEDATSAAEALTATGEAGPKSMTDAESALEHGRLPAAQDSEWPWPRDGFDFDREAILSEVYGAT